MYRRVSTVPGGGDPNAPQPNGPTIVGRTLTLNAAAVDSDGVVSRVDFYDGNAEYATIRAIMEAGAPHGIVPYGTEALGVMRIEKGHVAGNELNGMTTAADLGLGRMMSKKKDYIGRVMADRPALLAEDRPALVGFKPVDAGPLRNAAVLENVAMLWIHLAMAAGHGRDWTFIIQRKG